MIFNDKFDKKIASSDAVTMAMPVVEEVKEHRDETKHWQVIDTIIHPDGRKEVREYFNTVVDDCSKLIACLIKGQAGYEGLKYWAVGKGQDSWSNANPPSPSTSDTKLVAETYRKAIAPEDIVFLDSSNQPTLSITNKIQVKIVFEEGEANGELREFSLFGGNATSTKDSGIMINRKTHGLIYKTTGMKLERIIRIVF